MKARKIRVVGYPHNDPTREGAFDYFAVDAKTGAYIEGQIDVQMRVDSETGEKAAQIVIDCKDIVIFDEQGDS